MKYAVLLRGINVGGKNKVLMSQLREQVQKLGYQQVETYINSGNLFFDTQEPYPEIHQKLKPMSLYSWYCLIHISLHFFRYILPIILRLYYCLN